MPGSGTITMTWPCELVMKHIAPVPPCRSYGRRSRPLTVQPNRCSTSSLVTKAHGLSGFSIAAGAPGVPPANSKAVRTAVATAARTARATRRQSVRETIVSMSSWLKDALRAGDGRRWLRRFPQRFGDVAGDHADRAVFGGDASGAAVPESAHSSRVDGCEPLREQGRDDPGQHVAGPRGCQRGGSGWIHVNAVA